MEAEDSLRSKRIETTLNKFFTKSCKVRTTKETYRFDLYFLMQLLIKWLLSAIVIIITSKLLPGVRVDSFISALILAAILGLLNITIKPLLVILTIPVTIVTLGLFLLVINAFVILIADGLIDGFYVNGFLWALIFSIIISILQSIFESIIVREKK